jgi:DNA invertase Pin-like site-specific DNA recombinase
LVGVAAAFAVSPVTLWRWRKELDASGAAGLAWPGLAWHKPGPKGPSRLTDDMAADIRARRSGGVTLQAVADAVGVSVTTVRRALAAPTAAGSTRQEQDQPAAVVVDLPVLPPASDRFP